jgi:hypothetical protein
MVLKGLESKHIVIAQSTKSINNQKIRILIIVKIKKERNRSEKVGNGWENVKYL